MDTEIAESVAQVLKAVAHPIRLQIIETLEPGEMCVGNIVDVVKHPQAIVSQQLLLMKDKGVLDSRREGTNVYYHIKNKNVINLLHCVYKNCNPDLSKNELIQSERNSA